MPLRAGTYRLGDGYRTPARPDHRGQDFPADFGTPIYAVADGWVAHCGINDDPGGFGSWLVIDHQAEHGVDSVYGHMPPASLRVKFGDRVTAGQHIADVGSEGGSTGPHLHFEIWGPSGRFGGSDRDPLTWLAGAGDPAGQPSTPGGTPMPAQLDADVTILSPNDSGPRDPARCSLIVVHTNEGPATGSVDGLLNYLANPATEASYNLIIGGDGRIGRSNDDNYVPWAAGSPANERGLHLCLLGYSRQTRDEWLSRPAQLDAAARVLRDWSARYGIPLVKLSGAQMRAGQSGVGGHADTVDAWHATDHTDPGPGFPWDVLLAKANRTPAPNEETGMLDAIIKNFKGTTLKIRDLLWWLDKNTSDTREQLLGPDNGKGGFTGWSILGKSKIDDQRNNTLVEALAEVRADIAEIRRTLEGGK